ncbi:MAG: hypothetical protein ACK4UN_15450 [Limisphaerales bacterium]
MNQDLEHLRLLSIFHYVYAGVTALFSCFPAFYGVFGLFGLFAGSRGGPDLPPMVVSGIFLIIAFFGIVFVLGMAALTAYAGKCIADRKNYTFCIVVAALLCLSFPFGTALGVFTIVVLQRSTVRALFEQPSPPRT